MAPMAFLLALTLLGPAQAIAGKVVRHSDEFREKYPAKALAPLPDPLPDDVEALVAFVEAGNETPEVFLALGDALFSRDEKAIAYRAYHRAHLQRPKDGAWGRLMQGRKDRCPPVPHERIQAEENAAKVWVHALKEHERERLERGQDPRDLTDFYERFGRQDDNMWTVMRARRLSGLGGIIGMFVGAVFVLLARWMPRRGAFLPLIVGLVCAAGPALVGKTGLFYWGAGVALFGALATGLVGRCGLGKQTDGDVSHA